MTQCMPRKAPKGRKSKLPVPRRGWYIDTVRGLVAVAVVCGCSAGHPQARPDATDAPTTSDAAWFDSRPATAVIVGPDRILWTQQHGGCPLETGCAVDIGPTLTMEERATGVVTTVINDNWGADELAGDDREVFLLLAGDNENTRVLARFRPGVSTTPELMSAPQVDPRGLVVDDSYVYWEAGGANGQGYSVYRASRGGDGSDAVAIFTGNLFIPQAVFNGYLWSGGTRLPVAGGAVEDILPGAQVFPAMTSAGLLATKPLDPSGYYSDIGILAPDFSFHVLFPNVMQPYVPLWRPVADADELFWQGDTATLFRAQLTDTAYHADPRYPFGVGAPFAVTSDAILYNFTRRGFDSIPR